ncbi:MAG: flagellar biosynthesis protein FlhB [Planctomycetota bacterium]|jgi:flagellar biosynthetic protein FlhB
MPDTTGGEKTEAPTPRRRQEQRDEGNVPKSQDLGAGVLLFGAVILLGIFGAQMLAHMKILLRSMLNGAFTPDPTHDGDLGQVVSVGLVHARDMIAPIGLGLFGIALAVGFYQVGVLLTLKPLTPKLSKISPLRGFANMFSLKGLMRLAMSVLKVAVVMTVAFFSIRADLPRVLGLMRLETGPLIAAASWLIWLLAIKIAVMLLLLGILDYAYQKWQHEQDLKMTKQEVKEEMKRMDGDPQIKQRRAKVARQLALQRIGRDVPRADVVVTNPTHYAIALTYDNDNMNAPRVIAKGADFMALRIRQLAVMHGVPIVERPPMARALYRLVDVGQEIPPEYYAAVAEVLAYVYRLNDRKTA